MPARSDMENLGKAQSLQKSLDWIARGFYILAALGILALMIVTVLGVFWRYVLVQPIFGLQDVSSMLAAVVAAGSVAFGATTNSHITVNIMPKLFGRAVRRHTDIFARVLGAITLFLAASALIKKGNCGLPCGNITSNLSLPHGPFYYGLAAALGFYGVYLVIQTCVGLAFWRDEDPNEVVE